MICHDQVGFTSVIQNEFKCEMQQVKFTIVIEYHMIISIVYKKYLLNSVTIFLLKYSKTKPLIEGNFYNLRTPTKNV